MTGNTKSELRIPVQEVSDDDHVTTANTINDQFVKVSSNIPLLILFSRLSYQPKNPHHHSILGMCTLSSEKSNPPKQLAQMEFHPNLWKNLLMSWVHQ